MLMVCNFNKKQIKLPVLFIFCDGAMNPIDLDKAYISPYDRFLHDFDKNHPQSASQQAEIKKHERIFALRDPATSQPVTKS